MKAFILGLVAQYGQVVVTAIAAAIIRSIEKTRIVTKYKKQITSLLNDIKDAGKIAGKK